LEALIFYAESFAVNGMLQRVVNWGWKADGKVRSASERGLVLLNGMGASSQDVNEDYGGIGYGEVMS
jgi:hypothetical protein